MNTPLLPKNKFLYRAQLLLSLSLFISVVCSTVLFVSWQPITNVIYSTVAEKHNSLGNIPHRTQLVNQTLQYLRSPAIKEWKLVSSNDELPLTLSERQHMADVKRLFLVMKSIAVLSGLLTLIVSLFIYRQDKTIFRRLLKQTGTFLLTLPILLLIGILAFWNFSFTLFHQLLFADGTWAFPADSITILLFPETFWIAIFASYLVILIGIGMVMHFWARLKNQ